MARKGWDSLSADRRRRLERQGITSRSYAAGAPIRETRSYSQRAARIKERFGMTPAEYTKFRKSLPPEVVKERDRLARLAQSNPAEAKRQSKANYQSVMSKLAPGQRRIRVSFPGGEREVVNPIGWYH